MTAPNRRVYTQGFSGILSFFFNLRHLNLYAWNRHGNESSKISEDDVKAWRAACLPKLDPVFINGSFVPSARSSTPFYILQVTQTALTVSS